MALSSWLLTGAVLRDLVLRVFDYYTLLRFALLVLFRTTDHPLMTLGRACSRYTGGVLRTRFTGQHPTSTGTFSATLALRSMVISRIRARINHLLSALAPGMMELFKQARTMVENMTAEMERYSVQEQRCGGE
ncbi:hypothetical protein BJX68DRAFT_271700 [Aspergillus pseudodeflectus]|uniref:Uncharacterized protein n=1 Tax=Aspergillus pseudodeflectus TaxID=176178 RepID=A0ABR4JJY6_9EURO